MQRSRRAVPLTLFAVVVAAVALLLSSCSTASTSTAAGNSGNGSASAPASTTAPAPSTSSAAVPKKGVHIKLLNADGSTYGVGMPIIAYFSRKITNAAALQKATTATVNGKPIKGAWYFETSKFYSNYPIEGHFRPQHYWPAHSHVFVNIPAKGLSAGGDMAFNDSLTSSWRTGPANIGTVNDVTHKLTITSDGKHWGTFPVSLGAQNTPTARGTKVIMEKGVSICMTGPGYHECGIKYTQRLTYGGEYLHSAPWNCKGSPGCTGPQDNIGSADSSNGCTNLLPDDAARLYHFLRIGDVINYPNADGPQMSLGAGYGDWNLSWGQWLTGGLVPTAA